MMATKILKGLLLIIAFIPMAQLKAQVTQALVDSVKKDYNNVKNVGLVKVRDDLKWYITACKEGEKLSYEIQSTNNKISHQLFDIIDINFIGEHSVLAMMKNGNFLLVDLFTGKERELKGHYKALLMGKMLLLYENEKKIAFIFDEEGNNLLKVEGVKSFKLSDDAKQLFLSQDNNIISVDAITLEKREIKIKGMHQWIAGTEDDIWGISLKGKKVFLTQISQKGNIQEEIILPPYLETSAKLLFRTEVRERRFLILPITPIKNSPKSIPEVYYTSLSYEYAHAPVQLGIYDLYKKAWKWIPSEDDIYNEQKFVSKQDFISYDRMTKNYDTLADPKLKIHLYRSFGEKNIPIHNRKVNPVGLYYDAKLSKSVFFDEGHWWLEDHLKNKVGMVDSVLNNNFLNTEDSCGLSDTPYSRPIKIKGTTKAILTDKYDLFVLDLLNGKMMRLTKGREQNKEYRIVENKLLSINSLWDFYDNQEIDWSAGLLVQTFDKYRFFSSLELIGSNGKIKWKVEESAYIRNVKTLGTKVFYTTAFINQPMRVNVIDDGKARNILNTQSSNSFVPVRYNRFTYKGINGNDLDAVLLYPKDFQEGKKYPMIVEVYENTAKGIINDKKPFLNDGAGFNFMHYVYQNYFVLLPQSDLELGGIERSLSLSLEKLIKDVGEISEVNKDKIGLIGISFGGYEVTMIMAQSKLFATAVAGSSVIDLPRISLTYNVTYKRPDYWRVERYQHRLGFSLFDSWPDYLRNSPIYHIKNISKPLLLWLGQEDKNIEPEQTRSYFIALKRLKKDAVVLEYPKQQHNITDPTKAEDLNIKVWQWFDYFLKDHPPADWIKPLLQ